VLPSCQVRRVRGTFRARSPSYHRPLFAIKEPESRPRKNAKDARGIELNPAMSSEESIARNSGRARDSAPTPLLFNYVYFIYLSIPQPNMLILGEIYIRDLYISMRIHGFLVFVASRYLFSVECFFSRAFQEYLYLVSRCYATMHNSMLHRSHD